MALDRVTQRGQRAEGGLKQDPGGGTIQQGSQGADVQGTLRSRRRKVKAVGTFFRVLYTDTCICASLPTPGKPTVGAEHSLNSLVTNVVFVCFIEGNLWFSSPQET